MFLRQRHPDGDVQLISQLSRHFKLPAAWIDLLPDDGQEDADKDEVRDGHENGSSGNADATLVTNQTNFTSSAGSEAVPSLVGAGSDGGGGRRLRQDSSNGDDSNPALYRHWIYLTQVMPPTTHPILMF